MALLPKVKLKAVVSFPATVHDGVGIDVIKQNGAYQFDLDFSDFAPPVGDIANPTHQNALLWDDLTNSYVLAPVSLFGSASGAGDVTGPAGAATDNIAVFNGATGKIIKDGGQSIASLFAPIEQHITAAGPVAINNNTTIVRVDQTASAPITLTMGLASAKIRPVLISDWKGDAGANNITITLTAPDKFPGGLASWIIGSDTGSVFLRPIAGVGYAL